jgi:signal recognition particle GTPase
MAEEISQEQEEQKPGMHGCLKGCLIFLGVCVFAFIVTVGVVYYKRTAIKNWAVVKTFDAMETGLMESLPEDVDREKVVETLDCLETAIIEGDISGEELETLLPEFQRAMKDQELDTEEINHLLDVINEILTRVAKE